MPGFPGGDCLRTLPALGAEIAVLNRQPVKKTLHILFLLLAGLLAVGLLLVRFYPSSPRPPGPDVKSGAGTPAGKGFLILGSGPAGRFERISRDKFAFGEKIYATIEIEGVTAGDHSLNYRWINPRGGVQEVFRKEFSSPPESYRGWSWLELRGEDLFFFPLGPLGPGRLLGNWRIEVELDGQPLAGAGFTVR